MQTEKKKPMFTGRRAAALILAISLIAVMIPTAGAWAYSSSCPNTWSNTGDQAYDITQIALLQVGYTETSSDHTKYSAWYYGADISVPWCGIFISWCADQAGISTSVMAKTALASGYSTSNMSSNSFGAPAYSFASTSAKVGDIIYVDNNSDGVSNHVGLVYDVDDTYIYTVEGNSSGKVSRVKYLVSTGHRQLSSYVSSARILFYARPQYTGSGTSASSGGISSGNTASGDTSSVDPSSSGTYEVTASTLNIRSGAGSSYKVLATLGKGDRVTVTGTSNGWGSVSCSGISGWICMKYAKAVTVSSVSGSSSGSTSGSSSYAVGTYRTNQEMNIRSGPETTYSSIGAIAAGKTFTVTKTSGRFGYTSYKGKNGWVSLKYSTLVSSSGSSSAGSSSDSSSSDSSSSGSSYSAGTYQVNADALYVRSGAGTDYTAIGVAKKGYTFTTSEISGRFARITYKGKTGWISLKYCVKTS